MFQLVRGSTAREEKRKGRDKPHWTNNTQLASTPYMDKTFTPNQTRRKSLRKKTTHDSTTTTLSLWFHWPPPRIARIQLVKLFLLLDRAAVLPASSITQIDVSAQSCEIWALAEKQTESDRDLIPLIERLWKGLRGEDLNKTKMLINLGKVASMIRKYTPCDRSNGWLSLRGSKTRQRKSGGWRRGRQHLETRQKQLKITK